MPTEKQPEENQPEVEFMDLEKELKFQTKKAEALEKIIGNIHSVTIVFSEEGPISVSASKDLSSLGSEEARILTAIFSNLITGVNMKK